MLKTNCAALLFLAVAPGFAQCGFPSENSGRPLSYAFDPAVDADGTILQVTLSFQGGQDEVRIPTEWAGGKLHGLVNLRALSKDTVVADGNSPGAKLTGHSPNQKIVLAYDGSEGLDRSFPPSGGISGLFAA